MYSSKILPTESQETSVAPQQLVHQRIIQNHRYRSIDLENRIVNIYKIQLRIVNKDLLLTGAVDPLQYRPTTHITLPLSLFLPQLFPCQMQLSAQGKILHVHYQLQPQFVESLQVRLLRQKMHLSQESITLFSQT